MDRLLIVEDNRDVSDMLKESLTDAGYEVFAVYTGIDGVNEVKRGKYQLMLLDIMLPYKSGDEVLKQVRCFSSIPVIIISAKDMIGTKIDLLKLGADDYITKPFDLMEVSARVECQLRRQKEVSVREESYTYRDLTMNDGSKRVMVSGKQIELTAREYEILKLLLKYREKVFTRANIYETVWQEEYLEDDNAVKTHISNLRKKLKAADPQGDYLETVWGLGYRLYKES